MAPTTHSCEFEGCDWTTETETVSDYVQLLKIHVQARHPQNNGTSKAEKAKRPELSTDVSDEDWSYFKSRWDQYKKATSLTGEDLITQLLECCSESLRRDHHRTFSGATPEADITEETVLEIRGLKKSSAPIPTPGPSGLKNNGEKDGEENKKPDNKRIETDDSHLINILHIWLCSYARARIFHYFWKI